MSPGLEPEDGLRVRLRALRVDPPAGDFEARLHRRLAAAGAPEPAGLWERWAAGLRERQRWAWPALGLVTAALVLTLGTLLARPHVLPGTPGAAEVAAAVPVSKVAVVRLELTARVAVASASLRITLPEGLVFWSDGQALAQRSFEWTQPLSAGRNEIPIAVRGQHPGRYEVHLSAQVAGEDVEYDVPLEVTQG